ncbi:MAG: saccharopine dehydrogenase NADP-binding domain-containing protein [archaeon YNP-WB-062]|nr:saccharopine dehydrogenase NADP-binding domain-containing protein [Candidatus Culexarchaeum yellowstonense]
MGEVALIGFGNIGQAVAIDLVNSGFHPKVVDVSNERLKLASTKFGLETLKLDVSKDSSLDNLREFNVVITALPGSVAYSVLSKLSNLGVNVVDVSYFPESPWSLDPIAREKGSLIIVDAGWAPGLSNILLGYFHSKFGGLNIGRIYVGGLSLNSMAP